MLQPGKINTLTVQSVADGMVTFQDQITLLESELPRKASPGDALDVFVYNGSGKQLKATLLRPKGMLGDLVTLKVKEISPSGAWLDWGLEDMLFMPRGFHEDDLETGEYCLVKIIYDSLSQKVLGKEKLEDELSNETLTIKEKEVAEMIVYKDTPLGYQVIINGKHLGLLHYNEVFKDLFVGDHFTGFIKKIKDDNKIDVMIGKPGHTRIEDESEKILRLLKEKGGQMPYHDKSAAEDIYSTFGMSKKTFKMTIGTLYRLKKISIEADGIKLIESTAKKVNWKKR